MSESQNAGVEEQAQHPINPTNKGYSTDRSIKFKYDLENAPKNQKLLILCSSGVAHLGTITGNPAKDSDIWGYFKMPIRDKDLEEKLGLTKKRNEPSQDNT